MNTPLFWRPVKIRLYVAYMCDAYYGGFDSCDTGNTFQRVADESGSHPYNNIWTSIAKWYDMHNMGTLSDDDIMEQFATWRSVGFTTLSGDKRDGMSVMRSKQRWTERNWTRYEQRRNGRRQIAGKCVVPILACFGIVMPTS